MKMKKKMMTIVIVSMFISTGIFAVTAAANKIGISGDIPGVPEMPEATIKNVEHRLFEDSIYSLEFSTSVNTGSGQVYLNWAFNGAPESTWYGPYNIGETATYLKDFVGWGSTYFKVRASYNSNGDPSSDWSPEPWIFFSKSKNLATVNSVIANLLSNFPSLNLLLHRLYKL
jgi:hypothetical protein